MSGATAVIEELDASGQPLRDTAEHEGSAEAGSKHITSLAEAASTSQASEDACAGGDAASAATRAEETAVSTAELVRPIYSSPACIQGHFLKM